MEEKRKQQVSRRQMSLDVNAMVREAHMENSECILCGMCVDNCPKGVISYKFKSGKIRA